RPRAPPALPYTTLFRSHEITPHIPVTTNFMAHTCPNIDLWAWADEVDVVSNDHYLIAADERNFVELALDADLTRSIARGRSGERSEEHTSELQSRFDLV